MVGAERIGAHISAGDHGYALSSHDNRIYHFKIPLIGFTSYVSRLTHWDPNQGISTLSIPRDSTSPDLLPIFSPDFSPARGGSSGVWLARELIVSPIPLGFSVDRFRADMQQPIGGEELYPTRFVFATSRHYTSASDILRSGELNLESTLSLGVKVWDSVRACLVRSKDPTTLFSRRGVGDVVTIFEIEKLSYGKLSKGPDGGEVGHRLQRCATFQTSLKITGITVGPPGRNADEDMYLFVGGGHVSEVDHDGKGSAGIEMYVYQEGKWKLGWKSTGIKWRGLSSLAWWGGI